MPVEFTSKEIRAASTLADACPPTYSRHRTTALDTHQLRSKFERRRISRLNKFEFDRTFLMPVGSRCCLLRSWRAWAGSHCFALIGASVSSMSCDELRSFLHDSHQQKPTTAIAALYVRAPAICKLIPWGSGGEGKVDVLPVLDRWDNY